MCVCVCVCVCEKERSGREITLKSEREGGYRNGEDGSSCGENILNGEREGVGVGRSSCGREITLNEKSGEGEKRQSESRRAAEMHDV